MKKDVTNRTVAYLLLLALFVSIFGTMISLSRLGKVGQPMISGAATTAAGGGYLAIQSVLSISILNSSIDFGTCYPASSPGSWFDSNATSKDGAGTGQCDNLQYPGNLTIENDGSTNARVTINTSTVDLTGGSAGNKSFNYSIWNTTNRPGCYNFGNHTWQGMTALFNHTLCGNLTPGDTNDRVSVYFAIWAPSDSVAGARTATIIITAYATPS
jgi:hypothetical protein